MTNPYDVEAIRKKEYPHLEGQVYLDHAGMTIYSKALVERSSSLLLSQVFGNPHSQSIPSVTTSTLVEQARLKALTLFNADPLEYDICFTLNATHAIKILAQGFKDTFPDFHYAYNINSHTSMIGVRELASGFSVFTDSVDVKDAPTLISWTGQSNFSGERFPISEWHKKFKQSGEKVYTLLDAASLCSTAPPDLSFEDSPDFLVCSFYKMFGLPDIGGLVFKKSAAAQVFSRRAYFGGGTVDALSAEERFVKRSCRVSTLLEDGTVPVHSVLQLSVAIDTHAEIYGSFRDISQHTAWITLHFLSMCKGLLYGNGAPMVEATPVSSTRGPIVSFCLLSSSGKRLGYYAFEKYASCRGISIRTGTLCNIGGVSRFLGRSHQDIVRDSSMGHKCGDSMDVIDGKVTGVIRASFGAMTTKGDIDCLCDCISEFLVEQTQEAAILKAKTARVERLVIYPVKSCTGFSIPRDVDWPIRNKSLAYDREFCLLGVQEGFKPIMLKNHPRMVDIVPEIILEGARMVIRNRQSGSRLEISLEEHNWEATPDGAFEYCARDKVTAFLTAIVGVPCVLGRKTGGQACHNKSDFLLISKASLEKLGDPSELSPRFRANILVDGVGAYEEDLWSGVTVKSHSSALQLRATGKCERCHMITVDQNTGIRDGVIYKNLAKTRKGEKGKVYFGINLDVEGKGEGCFLKVGDEVLLKHL